LCLGLWYVIAYYFLLSLSLVYWGWSLSCHSFLVLMGEVILAVCSLLSLLAIYSANDGFFSLKILLDHLLFLLCGLILGKLPVLCSRSSCLVFLCGVILAFSSFDSFQLLLYHSLHCIFFLLSAWFLYSLGLLSSLC